LQAIRCTKKKKLNKVRYIKRKGWNKEIKIMYLRKEKIRPRTNHLAWG
jgi:hypothetical protein